MTAMVTVLLENPDAVPHDRELAAQIDDKYAHYLVTLVVKAAIRNSRCLRRFDREIRDGSHSREYSLSYITCNQWYIKLYVTITLSMTSKKVTPGDSQISPAYKGDFFLSVVLRSSH
jgi:hypothetical protein